MKRFLLASTALLALTASAQAGLISIGLQEAGTAGGAITTETTGSGTANLGNTPYGSFTLDVATSTDQAVLGGDGMLNTNIQNITSASGGTLHVFITAQNLTTLANLDGFLSSFALNDVHPGIASVMEQTFFDQGNGLYATTTPLDSHTFTAIGTDPDVFSAQTASTPFSLTEEYTIIANAVTSCGGVGQPACGNDNATIDMSGHVKTIPEPGMLATIGAALLGMWMLRRHRRAR